MPYALPNLSFPSLWCVLYLVFFSRCIYSRLFLSSVSQVYFFKRLSSSAEGWSGMENINMYPSWTSLVVYFANVAASYSRLECPRKRPTIACRSSRTRQTCEQSWQSATRLRSGVCGTLNCHIVRVRRASLIVLHQNLHSVALPRDAGHMLCVCVFKKKQQYAWRFGHRFSPCNPRKMLVCALYV